MMLMVMCWWWYYDDAVQVIGFKPKRREPCALLRAALYAARQHWTATVAIGVAATTAAVLALAAARKA